MMSSPIALPPSHIHRTHSELELELMMLRAEDVDAEMYSRLLGGIYSQIRTRCFNSGGYVHPLSHKSLQGIMKTKMDTDVVFKSEHQQQENMVEYTNKEADSGDDAVGWGIAYVSLDSSLACPQSHALHNLKNPKLEKMEGGFLGSWSTLESASQVPEDSRKE